MTEPRMGFVGVSNPLPAAGGRDEEPAEQVRELAPQALRSVQYRAVRAEDYDHAAERELAWVGRAGTRFRHTGSWLTVFTAVDMRASESLPPERRSAGGLRDNVAGFRELLGDRGEAKSSGRTSARKASGTAGVFSASQARFA